jgi:hypothetical protein
MIRSNSNSGDNLNRRFDTPGTAVHLLVPKSALSSTFRKMPRIAVRINKVTSVRIEFASFVLRFALRNANDAKLNTNNANNAKR